MTAPEPSYVWMYLSVEVRSIRQDGTFLFATWSV